MTNQQNEIAADDEDTHGAMFVPVILGSDKTTVSVTTGNNEYYPLYALIGNVHNNIHRAHRNAVVVIGFLRVSTVFYPTLSVSNCLWCSASQEYADSASFCKFRCQLFHTSLTHILLPLHLHMTKPCVTKCCDGNYSESYIGLATILAIIWSKYYLLALSRAGAQSRFPLCYCLGNSFYS